MTTLREPKNRDKDPCRNASVFLLKLAGRAENNEKAGRRSRSRSRGRGALAHPSIRHRHSPELISDEGLEPRGEGP
jgi:hypothetical protein